MTLTKISLAPVLIFAFAATGACSASQSPGPSPKVPAPAGASATMRVPTSPTPAAENAELRAAVTTYSDAFLSGDSATAYAILSERCKARTDEVAFASIVKSAAATYGAPLPFATYDAEVNGSQARVSYTYAVPAINQSQEPWAYEESKWHQDDC